MEIDISEECKIYSLEDKLCDFKNLYQLALKQLNENSKGILSIEGVYQIYTEKIKLFLELKESSLQNFSNNVFDKAYLEIIEANKIFNLIKYSRDEKFKNNKFRLRALPSEDDPMWQRVNSIMIREQLFVDSLQSHYDKFANISNQSYVLWQSQSYNEIIAERTAKTKAVGRGILGALSIAAAVASASAPRSEYNDDFSGEVAMLTLGGKLLEDAAKYKAEAKMHRDSIKELGDSIDAELAPNVIEFENKTIELSGNAKQQFIEWRNFLKKMYELEKTPDVQL